MYTSYERLSAAANLLIPESHTQWGEILIEILAITPQNFCDIKDVLDYFRRFNDDERDAVFEHMAGKLGFPAENDELEILEKPSTTATT